LGPKKKKVNKREKGKKGTGKERNWERKRAGPVLLI
jgi:hypothetical protein